MIFPFFEYQYMQNAIIASFFASIICGTIGVIIIEKKMIMMSGGIAHTSYGGVGLGYLIGIEPIWGAFLFSILAALGIGTLKRKKGEYSDIIIGILWPFGMALGIIFIALMPGYPPNLDSYLFGDILSVTTNNIILITILAFSVSLIIILFFNYWEAYIFDKEFASIMGINTLFLEYLLFIAIAMTVVILIHVVGIILVLALLTTPAAISRMFAKNLKSRMFVSIILSSIFCFTGLWLSYILNVASGAAIVVLSSIFYLLSFSIVSVIKKRQQKS